MVPRPALENPTRFLNQVSDPVFQEAYQQYEKGNYRKARSKFEKKIKNSPDHYPSYLAVGYTYLAEQNADLADKYIRKALELAPDYAQAHFALAYAFEQRQDYDLALAELSEVERLNPQYPSIQQNRNIMKLKATEMHLNEGHRLTDTDPAEAIRHLKAAMDLAPEVAQTPNEIAEIYLQNGDCKEAVSYLDIASERDPDNIEVKQKLGDCLVDMKEYNRALTVYEQLATSRPGDLQIRDKIESIRKAIFIQALPEEYHTIPNSERINRAQLAAYLMLNLESLQKYTPKDSKIIVDTLDHWAQSFILKAVNLGIIDLFPNRSFQPDLPITRLELAKAAARILEILESSQPTSTTEEKISIPDVPDRNIYYPMISKALSKGALSLDGDGLFHPSRSVSGAELLSMVNRLRTIAE